LIFLTVGTQFSFDRLVQAIDRMVEEGLINDEIVAQTGQSKYTPRHFKVVETLEKSVFDTMIQKASAIISHAGMGSIIMAFEYQKPLLVMPRLARYKEVVNDHQVGIARQFAQAGHLLMAMDEAELPPKIKLLKTFVPRPRENQSQQVAERIRRFLEMI
jgi:beta-1,4-N-acetylglucosaminyltransferase